MPRVSVYPDWVREQCPSGHTIKRNGNSYYLYKTTSVYVKGKKNPQPHSKYVGVITPDGVKYSSRRVVDTSVHPAWYEYGFTRCLYDRCFSILIKEFKSEELAEAVAVHVFHQLSPHSYVLKDKEVPSADELHVCICNQIRKIEEKLKIQFSDYDILKDIHLLEINGKKIITAVTDEQSQLIKKLGVNLYD